MTSYSTISPLGLSGPCQAKVTLSLLRLSFSTTLTVEKKRKSLATWSRAVGLMRGDTYVKCASWEFVNEKACKVSSTCVTRVCVCVCVICLRCAKPTVATSHPTSSHLCSCGFWNVFARACVCVNVRDMLWLTLTAARVTCGNLNEVNNFLHPFHLPASRR